MSKKTSRREFVAQSTSILSGAWIVAHMPDIEALGLEARAAQAKAEPFKVLTPAEARTMTAFAAQIVPTDSTPGATEAGAVYFIDKALTGFAAPALPVIRAGLKGLDDAASKENSRVKSFADLSPVLQIKIMKQQESSEFFGNARDFTVMGVFSDPMYGGGRNNARLLILNMEHKPTYQPPFGYYDAQETTSTKARGE
jgi:gluconate 2-dehydrogenase gamma chain